MLSTFVVTVFILVFLDTPRSRHGAYRPPETGVLVRHIHVPNSRPSESAIQGTLMYSVAMMLISLPTAILTYRCAVMFTNVPHSTKT